MIVVLMMSQFYDVAKLSQFYDVAKFLSQCILLILSTILFVTYVSGN